MDYKIMHLPDKNRFETTIDGLTSFVQYTVDGKEFDIIHTIVPRPLEGQGIAAALVKKGYDYARKMGLIPVASCSYAAAWLKRHPDYDK